MASRKEKEELISEIMEETLNNLPDVITRVDKEVKENPNGQMAKDLNTILENQRKFLKRNSKC